ncbi:MAG: hypothetical protein JRN54_04745 [Nitrososphaerota archaeon]|jgi:hypothetical protein|nr:hypothetical protein [Nitrososphaerota archaeon]
MKTVLSYGAGVNTFYMLLKLPEWGIKPDYVVFADTGNEQPATYDHLKRVAIPEMERQGLKFVTVKHPKWSSLLEYSLSTRKMPPRTKFRGQGRYCTTMFKLDPIIRFETSVRENKEAFTNLIGIAYDEIHRMSTVGRRKWITNAHPLVERHITREDCLTGIRLAGFEAPPKSSCDFCPFQKKSQWARTLRDNPSAIDDGINIELLFNQKMKEKLAAKGFEKTTFFSLRYDGRPLEEWRKNSAPKEIENLTKLEKFDAAQTFLDETCDMESCMT